MKYKFILFSSRNPYEIEVYTFFSLVTSKPSQYLSHLEPDVVRPFAFVGLGFRGSFFENSVDTLQRLVGRATRCRRRRLILKWRNQCSRLRASASGEASGTGGHECRFGAWSLG